MEFFKPFRADVQVGDTQTVEYGPFKIVAKVVADHDCHPSDFGFDCYTPEQIAAFDRGDWCMVGVVLSVWLKTVVLDDHAAACWGVDCNHDNGNAGSWISDIANDLLVEAHQIADRFAEDFSETFANT